MTREQTRVVELYEKQVQLKTGDFTFMLTTRQIKQMAKNGRKHLFKKPRKKWHMKW